MYRPPSALPGDVTVAPEQLSAEIASGLLNGAPATRLTERIGQQVGCSAHDAARVLYEVVRQVNLTLFPPIRKLELVLTEACNLACTYCFEKEMLRPGHNGHMPVEIATAAVDLLFAYSGESEELYVTHFGGEPLMNFSVLRGATEHAEQRATSTGKRVEFHITTNGVLLTEMVAEYFANHRVMVLLSVDGLEQTHNLFRLDRNGRGTFDQARRSLALLKRSQRWVGVKLTVMPARVHTLHDDVVGLSELGVNQFIIGHATGVSWSHEEMITYARQMDKVRDWYAEADRSEVRIPDFDDEPPARTYFGCQAARDSIAVSVRGQVSGCSKILALDRSNLISRLGDVFVGLTGIRNRAAMAGCATLKSNCERLGIDDEFHGGCFAVNYEENKDIFEPSLNDHRFSKLLPLRSG